MNANLTGTGLKKLAPLDQASRHLLDRSAERTCRPARTIADRAGDDAVTTGRLAEALQYRFVENS